MRFRKEITKPRKKLIPAALHLFLLALSCFLILTVVPQNNAVGQNANERDIQLPEAKNPKLPTIYLIGDSTVRNGAGDGGNGQWGWGSFLNEWLDQDKVNVVNRAIGGRSSRTYITQGYWDQLLIMLKPEDVVLIQFGHNDGGAVNDTSRARGVQEGIGDERIEIKNLLTNEEEIVYTYGAYLRKYISDIREKSATPIICSLVPRNWWENGEVIRNENNFAVWAEEVARAEDVLFVDLNNIISKEYDKMGPEKVSQFFEGDNTHTNLEGARFSANLVVEGIKEMNEHPLELFFSAKAVD